MSDLMRYLPKYYQHSAVMREILGAFECELDALNINVDELSKQFFIFESEKELRLHERDVGLNPDTAFPLDTRRGRVLSRLRGTGTVTREMLRNVVGSFVGGTVEITEEFSKYLITIKFTGYRGVPENIETIKLAVGEIQPAHLALEFEFTYAAHGEIKRFTHKELKAFSHKNIRTLGGDAGG